MNSLFLAESKVHGTHVEAATIGTIDPGRKMGIVFTCTVCENRCAKTFSHISYTKGIERASQGIDLSGVVLIECPSCKNRHLIADNLGWFKDAPTNIEGLVTEQGIPNLSFISYFWRRESA